jgi:hypothetical protein
MKKIMFDKNFLISDLKKQIDYLEKTNEDEIDINEVCKNLVFTSISPLYDFRDMILLETIKKMDEKISKMDNEERVNIKDLTQSFLPNNINEPYFSEIEDNLTLMTLRKRDNFSDYLMEKGLERFNELAEEYPIQTMRDKEKLEFKAFMQVGFEQSIYSGVYDAKEFIKRETKNKDFEFDYENLSRGELKAIRNGMVEREDYSVKEILNDLIPEKEKKNNKEIEY